MSALLMHACSAEGGRVAVSFLQVRQGLFVQLHGISGKPAFYLTASQMKPAARTHRETGLTAQINMKIVFFDMEQWLLTFSHNTNPTSSQHLTPTENSYTCTRAHCRHHPAAYHFSFSRCS